MRTVSNLGERKLIELASMIYHEHHDNVDLTDDCAILPLNGEYLLATSDMISEKTHIPKRVKPWQIGWFATAINLSDIAAKGGRPIGILLSLGLPRSFSESSFLDLIKGASSCADKYESAIIGGDTKENDHLVISGTALGKVKKDFYLSRNGAKSDDVVAVTGNLGKAAAGFYELQQDKKQGSINELCEPKPRVFEGISLAETRKVHCCMDISDGLSSSLYQLGSLNNLGFHIQSELLPISPRLKSYAEKDSTLDILHLALHFGGDYELLLTAPSEDIDYLQQILNDFNTPLTVIGKVIEENAVYIDRKSQKKTILPNLGYEHFKDR
jgi:thiamine-monophosphate kinase